MKHLEATLQVTCPEEDTPRRGMISPILSNIYLPYVLD